MHRIGDGIAEHLNLTHEFVADSVEEYASKAVSLANETLRCRQHIHHKGAVDETRSRASYFGDDGDGEYDDDSSGLQCDLRNRIRRGLDSSGMIPSESSTTVSECSSSSQKRGRGNTSYHIDCATEWEIFLRNVVTTAVAMG